MAKRDTYIDDEKGRRLFEGDLVAYQVRRVTQGYFNNGRIQSKADGFYRMAGQIHFHEGIFVIVAPRNFVTALAAPRGAEQYDRGVWFKWQTLHEAEHVERIRTLENFRIEFQGQRPPERKA